MDAEAKRLLGEAAAERSGLAHRVAELEAEVTRLRETGLRMGRVSLDLVRVLEEDNERLREALAAARPAQEGPAP